MNKSHFTEQQIAFAFQQAETGTPVPEVCRKMGIAEATYYRCKQRYGDLMPSEQPFSGQAHMGLDESSLSGQTLIG